jgi:hypothetical protein
MANENTQDEPKEVDASGSSHCSFADTTNPVQFVVDTSGFVVELEKSVWLLAADADPSRTLVLKNATRWPTERSAKRALSRVRKYCRHKFYGATIYHVK